ncbi:hypothetical protein D9M68_684220 [compost metagenome]
MHLGHVDVLRGDAGLFEGGLAGQVGATLVEVLGGAGRCRAHHAGQYLDRAVLVEAVLLQRRFGAEDGGSGAIGDGRAHRQGDRVGDRRRGEDFLDAHGVAVLGALVVHRVAMVLRGHGGQLALGDAVALHQAATAQGRIDVHERAVGLLGLGAGRRHDALAHGGQVVLVLLEGLDVPGGLEGGEHLHLVAVEHLLRAHGDGHVGGAGAQLGDRQAEGVAGGGAGALDVEDRDAVQAQRQQRHLATDHVLAVEVALGAVAEETDLDPRAVAAGVLQGIFHRPGGELLDGLVGVAAESGHADADYVYVFHRCLESF